MPKSEKPKRYKTIVISDVHLGSKWSAAKEATDFIRNNSCQTLILNGDIIDGWAIMRGSKEKWKRRHSAFVQEILSLSHNTKIDYIRGNHDDFLTRLIPMHFSNISILEDCIVQSGYKRYLVLHGDIFDNVTSSARWLSKLGDIGYSILLMINNIYNRRRIRKGKQGSSFASNIKQRVKTSVSALSDFEQNLANLARSKGCDGVICGHIHRPEIKVIDGVEYLNSGDWIDSLSALVEDFDGNWSLVFVEKEVKEQRAESEN